MIINIEQIKFKKIRELSNFLTSQSLLTNIEDNFSFGNKINNTVDMFSGCWRLTSVPNFNTVNVISMESMFQGCGGAITTVPNFNTSNVINMCNMFEGCYNLINVPDFNTINVINMKSMFDSCPHLATVPNFNTSNVKTMAEMFYNCHDLKTMLNFNTINVLNMYRMFYNCDNLISIPNFNTSNVINMNWMFIDCDNLTIVPNFDTSNVIDMGAMFQECHKLTITPNFNTNKVNHMEYMFYGCDRLTNIYSFDIGNVTNMAYMFTECGNLKNLPIFNSIPNAQTNMAYMFGNCQNLTTINNNAIINLFNQTYSLYETFTNCNSLTQSSINNIVYYLPNTNNLSDNDDYSLSYLGFSNEQTQLAISNAEACNRAVNNGWNIQTIVNYNVLYKTNINETEWTIMPLDNILSSNNAWAIENCFNANTPNKETITNLKVNNLPKVTNLFHKFSDLLNLKNIEELNVPKVENMAYIFFNCKNLIAISNINTINVKCMLGMFHNCSNLVTVPNFDTSNVTDMDAMFYRCNNLTTIPNFNTINVTSMSNMFQHCGNHLTTIPNFNTSNVKDMNWMFSTCGNLTTIPNFNTSNVTSMYAMFSYCYNLTTVPNFDTSNVTDMRSMFISSGLTIMPNFNTSKVTGIEYIFRDCDNLTTVPNFDTSNVTNIVNAFRECRNLSLSSCENILYSIPYYNNIIDTDKYPIINYFAGDSALTNNNIIANLNSAAIDTAEKKGWFLEPTLRIDYVFDNSLTGANKISITDINGLQQVQGLKNMVLASCNNDISTTAYLNSLVISGTSENLELTDLFKYGDTNLSIISGVNDLSFIVNTSLATNACNAFRGATELINLNGLKTNNIINASNMFRLCGDLNIQWNSWNFYNVQNGYQMFSKCNLQTMPTISLPSATNIRDIFSQCIGITSNTMQNIIETIPDYTQLIDDINPDNTLNYLGITNNQINMLSNDYKQMAADKHWKIPGFTAREKVSILPICNNLGVISNYDSDYDEYPMEIIYDDTYGDYFLQSKNQGKQNSTSSAIINFSNELVALCGSNYYMDIYYSCEGSWDYLQIFKMNNGSSSWVQIGESKYTGYSGMDYLHSSLDLENIQVGDQLRFTFYKDGSGDRGLDGCLISIYGYKTDGAYEITYSLVDEPEITKYKIIPKK